MHLTSIQKNAVDQLVNKYFSNKKKVDFQAPTGSGKTFMIANFIDQVIRYSSRNEKLVFVIATLSSSDLPRQFENKLNSYSKYLSAKNGLITEYYDSPSSHNKTWIDQEMDFKLVENKVYIFGKSSFGKNRLYTEDNTIKRFIEEIKLSSYKLIYIRDEAHYGLKQQKLKDDESKFESLLAKNADFIIYMSATLKGHIDQVIIKEKDLNNNNDGKFLLKTHLSKNKNLKTAKYLDDNDVLEQAIKEFLIIKQKYKILPINIKPAMLIQVTFGDINDLDFKRNINNVKNQLIKNNLSYVIHFGNYKEASFTEDSSLEAISKIDSSYDVIIFKVGPATGWDIPRACMLVQLRNVCSEILNQQTLGRIKRNPFPDLREHEITKKYYLYSNYSEKHQDISSYALVDKYKKMTYLAIRLKNKSQQKKMAIETFKNNLSIFLKNKKSNLIDKLKEDFSFEKTIFPFNPQIQEAEGDFLIHYKVTRVEKKLENCFEIKKEVLNYFEKNTFLKYVNDELSNFFKNQIALGDEHKFNINQFLIILFQFYMKDILEEKNKAFKYNYDNPEYEVAYINEALPEYYIVWENSYSNKKREAVSFKKVKDNYMYINLNEDSKYLQHLDSISEKIFLKKVIKLIIELKKDGIHIQCFCKNPVLNSKVYFEYLNDINILAKAYIDFIFKIKDKWFYIEIKSKDEDYDKSKTKALENTFEIYSSQIKNKNLFFTIVYIDKINEHEQLYVDQFFNTYDPKLINKNKTKLKDLFRLIHNLN